MEIKKKQCKDNYGRNKNKQKINKQVQTESSKITTIKPLEPIKRTMNEKNKKIKITVVQFQQISSVFRH